MPKHREEYKVSNHYAIAPPVSSRTQKPIFLFKLTPVFLASPKPRKTVSGPFQSSQPIQICSTLLLTLKKHFKTPEEVKLNTWELAGTSSGT